jgi:catechol 2,3-dioxygenase-like lactoylglutathione lyase family enzyme
MLLKRLSHVCIATPDLDRLLGFYCGLLDCRIVHRFQRPGTEVYGYFLLIGEGTFLEVFKDPAAPAQTGSLRHFCFQVEDIRLVAERLRSAGIEVAISEGRTDHVLLFQVEDPDGRTVEFHQFTPESMQFPFLPKGQD